MIHLLIISVFLGLKYNHLKINKKLIFSFVFFIPLLFGFTYNNLYFNIFIILVFFYYTTSIFGRFFKIVIPKDFTIVFICLMILIKYFEVFKVTILQSNNDNYITYEFYNQSFEKILNQEKSHNLKIFIYHKNNLFLNKKDPNNGDYKMLYIDGNTRIVNMKNGQDMKIDLSKFGLNRFSFLKISTPTTRLTG